MAEETTGEVLANALRRVAKSNFQTERATEAERETLAKADRPVTDPLAQDYAAWRRSAALMGAIALVVWGVIELASHQETAAKMRDITKAQAKEMSWEQAQAATQQTEAIIRAVGTDNLDLIDGIKMLVAISIIVGAVFLVMASRAWADVRISRRWARIAFYIIFLTPFCMAAIPFTALMDFDHLDASGKKSATLMLGLELGLYLFMLVGPRALALFPAVTRSSISLKTLIPESPLAGWAATIMSFFYPIVLIVVVAFLNQVSGSLMLLGGIVCLVTVPLIYSLNAKEIMRPHTEAEVGKFVIRIRAKVIIFNLVGFGLLAAFLLDLDFFEPMDVAKFVAAFLGNFMLVTLVASDLILALLRAGHEQTMAFKGTGLAKALDAKFAGLAGVGLTDLKVTKDEAPEESKE